MKTAIYVLALSLTLAAASDATAITLDRALPGENSFYQIFVQVIEGTNTITVINEAVPFAEHYGSASLTYEPVGALFPSAAISSIQFTYDSAMFETTLGDFQLVVEITNNNDWRLHFLKIITVTNAPDSVKRAAAIITRAHKHTEGFAIHLPFHLVECSVKEILQGA